MLDMLVSRRRCMDEGCRPFLHAIYIGSPASPTAARASATKSVRNPYLVRPSPGESSGAYLSFVSTPFFIADNGIGDRLFSATGPVPCCQAAHKCTCVSYLAYNAVNAPVRAITELPVRSLYGIDAPKAVSDRPKLFDLLDRHTTLICCPDCSDQLPFIA